MKSALMIGVLSLAACLMLSTSAKAVQDSFLATGNATVQPAGPRTGANGTNFFNIEGSTNAANSSYGVIDIPLSSANFGGTVTGVNSVVLNLTESNAAFTAPGHFSVYLTTDTTTSINNTGTSPLRYILGAGNTNTGTATVGPVAPDPDTLFPLTLLGTFNFTTTGNTNTGQVDSVPLTFTGAALTDLVSRINSNSTLRLVLTPDDLTTAATFVGATNTNAPQRQTLVVTALVAGLPYWDVNGSAPGLGGTGTWNTTTPNFNDSSGTGTPFVYDSSKLTVFSGPAPGGTVTIGSGGITENGGIEFDTDGYVVQGTTSSDALTLGTKPSIDVSSSSATVTMNAKLSGSNGLTKLGPGALVLAATNSDFTGTVTIGGGTLQISSDANLGPTGNGVALSGGTLKLIPAGNLSLDVGRTLSGTGGSVNVGTGNTFTVNGSATMTGPLTLSVNETVVLAGGTKTLGGVTFTTNGTLTAGTGTDTIAMNGSITAGAASGTTTINGSVDFGGTARSISLGTGTGKLVITGGIIANGASTAHVSVSGTGTLDVQGDNSQFVQPITIGSSGTAGPTVLVHDTFSLGYGGISAVTMFFNSGTVSNQTGNPIVFGTGLLDSIGSTTAQPAVFTGNTGGSLEFQGAVNLFRPTTGQNQITVNNSTTFSGGWTASVGTATNNSGVLVNGTGTLTLSTASGGTLGLDVPLAVSAATVLINSAMTNSAANVSIIGNGTVRIGVDNALNSGASLTVGAAGVNGTFDLNGHDQTVAAVHLLGGSITGVGHILTSTTDFDVQAGTDSAILSGAVGLVKSSTGTVTLSAVNTYTGTTTVNGGSLILTGTLASPTLSLGGGTLTVSNATGAAFAGGTTLTPGPSSINASALSVGSVVLGAITRSGGATLDFTLPTGAATITTTTANANFAGGQQSILSGYATVGGTTSTATWAVSGSGATPGIISGLQAAGYSSSFSAVANVDPAAGTPTPGTMTINSLRLNGAGVYTIGDSGGGDTLTIATGGILETTNVGANAVTISVANLATGNGQDLIVHQYNTAAAMTIGSAISGSGGLTKTGGGNLILSGAKTFSGNTTIGSGTLTLTDSLGLQNSTLDYSYGGSLSFGSLTAATLGGLKGTNNLALGAVALTIGNNNSSNTYSGVLSGTGRLIKVGTGTEILTGTSTYSGATGTTISNGILQVGNGGTTGAIPNIATSIASGAQLVFNRSNALTFSGVTSGAGALTQAGTGTLTLTGANTYTGATNINAGILNAGVAQVGTTSGPFGVGGAISFGGGTLQYSTVNQFDYSPRFSTAASQAYNVDTNAQSVTWAGNLTSSGGTLTKLGTGTLTLAGNNTYTGGTTINAGTLALGSTGAIGTTGTISFGGGTLQYTSSNTTDYSSRLSTVDGQAYRVDPNGQSIVWASNLVNNGGSLAVAGTAGGTLDLQGNNSGLVAASGGASITLGTVTSGGPTLIVHNPNSLGVGEFRFNGGKLQAATPIVFGSGVTMSIGAAGSTQAPAATFAGSNVEFQGAVSLFKSGGNSSRITVNNTTTFSGGFAAATGTGADPSVIIAGTGTLNVSGGVMSEDLPITVDTVKMNINSSMTNNAANFTIVNSGKVTGGVDNALPTGATLTFGARGGTYSTGGHNQTLSTLTVGAGSAIDLGSTGTLQFAPTDASTWTAGNTVSILHWVGTPGPAGSGTDKIIFGGSNTGLTNANLGATDAKIHFQGYNGADILAGGEVVPDSVSTRVPGDFNVNGHLDAGDITAMLSALTDLNAYKLANSPLHSAFPNALTNDDLLNIGDVNSSGGVTNADIQAELDLLASHGLGSVSSVPEPATLTLLVLAVPALVLAARRRSLGSPAAAR